MMGSAQTAFWDDDRIARLKRLYAEGLSAAEIGQIIGCTRSTVLGKLWRLNGMAPRKQPSKPKPAPKPLYIDADSARDIAPNPVEPPSLRVSITDIRDHMCKWPSGDPRDMPTFSFCGHPTTETYCPYYKRKASGGVKA